MWSKLLENSSELALIALSEISNNTYDFSKLLSSKILHYHNIEHIKSMYDYLEKNGEPYSAELDYAILFHDVIYDKESEKEKRSADFFLDKFKLFPVDDLDTDKVVKYILATIDHLCYSEDLSQIIRADLHQLTDKVKYFTNYCDIMKESMALYDIDELQFAKASKEYMSSKLMPSIHKNLSIDNKHEVFYRDVKKGIFNTIALSNLILGD